MVAIQNTKHPHAGRLGIYGLSAALLIGSGFWLQGVEWEGSAALHTLMESLATLLAFMVGAMALVRYFSQRDNQFLYIGSGFIGTALLDAYHTIVTATIFQPYMPSDAPHLVPWSWIASRLFLSVLMLISWLLWHLHRNEKDFASHPKLVFLITALATTACFYIFSRFPLPNYSIEGAMLARPFELLPAIFFAVALVGYLGKGAWRHEAFEHWLVLSLIVGLATQAVFMPFSQQLNDLEFNVAHLLKKLSYLLVLIGLMYSLFETYIALKLETEKRKLAEEELREEAQALAKSERWFRAVADYTYDWETWISPEGKTLYTSPACERITGYTVTDFMSGKVNMTDILSPHEPFSTFDHFRTFTSEETCHGGIDFRILTRSGEERWINHVCRPIFDENNNFIGRRGGNRDITERKRAELETRTLTMAVEHSPAAVVITDENANIEYVNPAFVDMTGYESSEVHGKNPRILKSGQHSDEFYKSLWATLTSGEVWIGEFRNKHHDGKLYWESAAIAPIRDMDGNIKKYVAVKQEITEKKLQEETLYHQANFDALTGLPNRVLFNDRLELAIKKMPRSTGTSALMMLDLDHFKEVNDTFGHEVGDDLLRQAAERMQRCVRETDTVGRIGGDEFILLLESYSGVSMPNDVAQRLLDELSKPFIIYGHICNISASIGVAFLPHHRMNADLLKRNADTALYQAKEQGRNRAVYFNQPEATDTK